MDDQVPALYTAAKRFCMDRQASWSAQYTELIASGKARNWSRGFWVDSPVAYQFFPKERFNKAILSLLEDTTGEQTPSLADVRVRLTEAADLAFEAIVDELKETPEALPSLKEEVECFCRFVREIGVDELAAVEPLPFRRALTPGESEDLWNRLKLEWDVRGYFWYPLVDVAPDTNVIAFHDELWEVRQGQQLLHQALRSRNIKRCFVFHETDSSDSELDSALVDASYDGGETFATSDFTWLVYASHESSITVAGWLADFFRSKWPDWAELTYCGPFHTDDLRGTWNPLTLRC